MCEIAGFGLHDAGNLVELIRRQLAESNACL